MIDNPKGTNQIGYYKNIAEIFNVHPEKVRKRWRMLQTKKVVKETLQELLNGKVMVETKNSTGESQIQFETDKDVRNPEDLAKVVEIDLNKYVITHSQIRSHINPKGQRMYAVKVSIKPRKVDEDLSSQKEIVLEEIKKAASGFRRRATSIDVSPFVKVDVSKRAVKDCALEINIPDLHIGKLAWGKESGEDYDIKIAIARYKAGVKDLLSRVNPLTLEKFILPVGNDMINIDNKANTTTGGTPQSCDSRFGKMFQTAKELLIETIDELSQIAPVEVMVVPGNHDTVAMFTLGEVLDAWYHNNDQVTVINTHAPRKYLQYGNNLIMYVHGHNEKLEQLGIICATEQPHLWAATKFRRVHVGHFHHAKQIRFNDVQEYPGFTVKVLNSLSANDAWHAEKGYMSLKAAEAFLYHRERGLLANFNYIHQ